VRATCGLAALLAGVGLAAAGSAAAAIPSGNLLANGNAEQGAAARDGSGVTPPPSWTVSPGFTQIAYGSPQFLTTQDSQALGGGNAFFAGGPSSSPSTADQTVNVSVAAPEIDAGDVDAALAALLGGFSGQTDNTRVDATFLGSGGAALLSARVGPVGAQQRNSVTTLLPRSIQVAVPAGTRSIAVRVTATRVEGSYNDGYADNVSLALVAGGSRTLADLPAPVLGKLANVEPVKGKVRVAVPLTAAQKGLKFVPLEEARQIPVGSFLDTRKGTVRLQSAAGAARKSYKGDFNAGLFQVVQSRKKKAKGLTNLVMKGSSFAGCGAKKARAALSKKALRRLRGSAKGRFRTRGRYSAATVRGTKWTVTDRCDGTLTKVTRGKVEVRDFRRHKTILVKTGKSYLARAGRLP
jgi:hypothetical protein